MSSPSTPKRNLLIGRSAECDIVLPYPEVSGRHAILTIHSDGSIEIRDVGSKNGTFINGQRVQVGKLQPGDTLQLGSHKIDWEELLRNPPSSVAGTDSPTRMTRLVTSKDYVVRGLIYLVLALGVAAAILWFFVRPWVFHK
ncbi:MAG: FHA domain-containing protein [Bacteroidia bacterium]|nr:FHA domain-containing protein [Bacteroidia bacterium]MDW8089613.1 FHA domain-containing protein [Bacteroidia bacterium]